VHDGSVFLLAALRPICPERHRGFVFSTGKLSDFIFGPALLFRDGHVQHHGGSEYTRNYALSYIKTLVHIGFKLFLVTVVIHVGVFAFMKTTWGMVGSDAESLIQTCMMLIGQSFLFVAIIKVIPQIADTLISGVSMNTFSGASAVRSGTMSAAGLAVGAASMTYNAPGKAADVIAGGVSAVQSAANAYSGNFNAYKSQGLNSVRAGVSALGSAIWSGYQVSRGHGNQGVQNGMAGKPGILETPGSSGPQSAPPAAQLQNSNPATEKSESIQSDISATEPPKAAGAKEKGQKVAYSAPTPEELAKKFKTWN
jgi:type IV secretory pathway TrbL component